MRSLAVPNEERIREEFTRGNSISSTGTIYVTPGTCTFHGNPMTNDMWMRFAGWTNTTTTVKGNFRSFLSGRNHRIRGGNRNRKLFRDEITACLSYFGSVAFASFSSSRCYKVWVCFRNQAMLLCYCLGIYPRAFHVPSEWNLSRIDATVGAEWWKSNLEKFFLRNLKVLTVFITIFVDTAGLSIDLTEMDTRKMTL